MSLFGDVLDFTLTNALQVVGIDKKQQGEKYTLGSPDPINAIPVVYGRPGWVTASSVIAGSRLKNYGDADQEVEYNRLTVYHAMCEGVSRIPDAIKIEGKLVAYSKKYSAAQAALIGGESESGYLNSYYNEYYPGYATGVPIDHELDWTDWAFAPEQYPAGFKGVAVFKSCHNTKLTGELYSSWIPKLEFLPNGVALHDPRIVFSNADSYVYQVPDGEDGYGLVADSEIKSFMPKWVLGGVAKGWSNANVYSYLRPKSLVRDYDYNETNELSPLGDSPDNNNALVVLDYLFSTIYGGAVPLADISIPHIIDAANYCDALAPTYSGGPTQAQMACNLVIGTDKTLKDNLEKILATCRGKLAWVDGQYQLHIFKAGDVVRGELIPGVIISRKSVSFGKRKNRLNRVIATYIESNVGYESRQVVFPEEGSAEDTQWRVVEDKEVLNEKEITLDGCTNAYQAADLVATLIKESRASVEVGYICTLEALEYTVGDIVRVDDPDGLWTQKLFRIVKATFSFIRGTVELFLREHLDSCYDNLVKPILVRDEGEVIDALAALNANLNVTLTSGDSTLYVGKDGSVLAGLLVSWGENSSLSGFEVEYKLSSEISYTRLPVVSGDARSVMIRPIVDGENYDVRVRGFNRSARAAWQDVFGVVALGRQAPPPPVVQFFVDGNSLSWVEPVAKPLDFAGYVLRYHIGFSEDWNTAQPVHEGVITQTQFQVPFALYDQMVLLIKSVDTTGNLSADAAVIARGFGDLPAKNIFFKSNILNSFDYRVVESGEVQVDGSVLAVANGNFYETSLTDFYDTGRSDVYDTERGDVYGSARSDVYDADDFFAPWGYSGLSCIYAIDLPATILPGEQVYISVGVAGTAQSIEVGWGGDSAVEPVGAWRSLPRVLSAPELDRRLFVRIAVDGDLGVRSALNSLSVLVDVPDIEERFNDVSVLGNYQVPIVKKYRAITNISMTLQDDGGSAVGAVIVSKDNLAPIVRCVDASNSAVAGKLDITIQGY